MISLVVIALIVIPTWIVVVMKRGDEPQGDALDFVKSYVNHPSNRQKD